MLQYTLNPKKITQVVFLWLLHITPRFFWICQNPYGNEGHFNIFFTNEKKITLWFEYLLFSKLTKTCVYHKERCRKGLWGFSVGGNLKKTSVGGNIENLEKMSIFFYRRLFFCIFFKKTLRGPLKVFGRWKSWKVVGRSSVGRNFEISFQICSK